MLAILEAPLRGAVWTSGFHPDFCCAARAVLAAVRREICTDISVFLCFASPFRFVQQLSCCDQPVLSMGRSRCRWLVPTYAAKDQEAIECLAAWVPSHLLAAGYSFCNYEYPRRAAAFWSEKWCAEKSPSPIYRKKRDFAPHF